MKKVIWYFENYRNVNGISFEGSEDECKDFIKNEFEKQKKWGKTISLFNGVKVSFYPKTKRTRSGYADDIDNESSIEII